MVLGFVEQNDRCTAAEELRRSLRWRRYLLSTAWNRIEFTSLFFVFRAVRIIHRWLSRTYCLIFQSSITQNFLLQGLLMDPKCPMQIHRSGSWRTKCSRRRGFLSDTSKNYSFPVEQKHFYSRTLLNFIKTRKSDDVYSATVFSN